MHHVAKPFAAHRPLASPAVTAIQQISDSDNSKRLPRMQRPSRSRELTPIFGNLSEDLPLLDSGMQPTPLTTVSDIRTVGTRFASRVGRKSTRSEIKYCTTHVNRRRTAYALSTQGRHPGSKVPLHRRNGSASERLDG